MITCTVKRRCVTGATDYLFYRGNTLISATSVLTLPPGSPYQIHFQCGSMVLSCSQDPEVTVYSGSSTSLFTENPHKEYARLVFLSANEYELRIGQDTIHIIDLDSTHFYHNNTLIAVMEPVAGPVENDQEPVRTLKTVLPLTDTMLVLLMSFPLYQI